jgi:hypothetical protein
MACVRTTLAQVLYLELVGKNCIDFQYILWTVSGDANINTRCTHCYNRALKSHNVLSLSGFLDTFPSHYPKLFSQNPSNISKVPHIIFESHLSQRHRPGILFCLSSVQ